MLKIKNLKASIEEKIVLQDVNLEIKPGEIHVIMGPNGSGKSALSNVLAGKDKYQVLKGEISFLDKDMLNMSPEERAVQGLFLAFQYPIEIDGVSNLYFIKTAFNSIRKRRGEEEFDSIEFLKFAKEKAKILNLSSEFFARSVNVGFSGGEKKKNSIFQMLILEPRLAVLDEIDSGLDIDSLKLISEAINDYKNSQRSLLLVTHYKRLLDYIIPDYVHILVNGKIVKSGDYSLVSQLEKTGYSQFEPLC